MRRINRLRSITISRIDAFLSSLEKPEMILPQLVKEMADATGDAARAEAKAMTAVAADRRRLDAANGRVSRLAQGARLALQANDEVTARQAVAAQIQAERDVEQGRESLRRSESAYESATYVRQALQKQLAELEVRKREILARARSVGEGDTAGRSQPSHVEKRMRNILDAVAQMETTLEEQETERELHDQITQTLGVTFQHERVIERENDAEVDRRLEILRKEAERDTST